MTITDLVALIEAHKYQYEVGELQSIRKRLKNLAKMPQKNIFRVGQSRTSTVDDNAGWGFHFGGRSELQFNIGIEHAEQNMLVRYGVAFNMEPSQNAPVPWVQLRPSIARFNQFLTNHMSSLCDLSMTYNSDEHETLHSPFVIDNALVRPNEFIFLGKYVPLAQFDLSDLLHTFDRLLTLYIFVESQTLTLTNENFVFKRLERVNKKLETQYQVCAKTVSVNLKHNNLSDVLEAQLIAQFGEAAVSMEKKLGRSMQCDALVKQPQGHHIYEIKSYTSVKHCIREALGQLLDYAHWPQNHQLKIKELVVVGTSALCEDSQKYLSTLQSAYNLPLKYQQLSV